MVQYRKHSWRDIMNNMDYTYEQYLVEDKEYREIEHLLDKYCSKVDYKKYIEDKYMDDFNG